ncbi:hypothetical protein CSKR_109223, partial [Clonorchis sinensis]
RRHLPFITTQAFVTLWNVFAAVVSPIDRFWASSAQIGRLIRKITEICPHFADRNFTIQSNESVDKPNCFNVKARRVYCVAGSRCRQRFLRIQNAFTGFAPVSIPRTQLVPPVQIFGWYLNSGLDCWCIAVERDGEEENDGTSEEEFLPTLLMRFSDSNMWSVRSIGGDGSDAFSDNRALSADANLVRTLCPRFVQLACTKERQNPQVTAFLHSTKFVSVAFYWFYLPYLPLYGMVIVTREARMSAQILSYDTGRTDPSAKLEGDDYETSRELLIPQPKSIYIQINADDSTEEGEMQ